MSKIIEVNHIAGTVEYGVRRSFSWNTMNQEENHIERFHSLAELLQLTNPRTCQDLQNRLQASHVEVEAICFHSSTPDSRHQMEFLLMKDTSYGQIIQSA